MEFGFLFSLLSSKKSSFSFSPDSISFVRSANNFPSFHFLDYFFFFCCLHFDKPSEVERGDMRKFHVIKTFRLSLSQHIYTYDKKLYYLLTGMCTYMTTVHYENWNKLLCIRWRMFCILHAAFFSPVFFCPYFPMSFLYVELEYGISVRLT